jgi:hypothetical protein
MPTNNINFFGWIREGVKQSVLMGVSDAIETIGTPEDTQGKLHPTIAAMVSNSTTSNTAALNRVETSNGSRPKIGTTASPAKKRLGRSLKDIGPQA